MFWRFFEPYAFLNGEERGESLTETISANLFGATYWSSYGGSIYSRYLYDYLLENAGDVVHSIDAISGKALVLRFFGKEGHGSQLREVIEALNAVKEYGYFDAGDFSDWEYEITDKELNEGYTGQYLVREVNSKLSDLIDSPEPFELEQGSELFWAVLRKFVYSDDAVEYPYWETAEDLLVPGLNDIDAVAMYVIEQVYAPSLEQEESLF